MSGKHDETTRKTSTPILTTTTPEIREIDASKLKRILDNANKCGKCKSLKENLKVKGTSVKDERMFHHTVDTHLSSHHPVRKRLSSKPKMDKPNKLTIQPKTNKPKLPEPDSETDSDISEITLQNMSASSENPITDPNLTFASEYASDSAKTVRIPEREKSSERPAKKPANEFEVIETAPPTESLTSMETDYTSANEISENHTPRKALDLNLYLNNNSPTREEPTVSVSNRFEPLNQIDTEATTSENIKKAAEKPNSTPKRPPTKKTMPPPIVIVGEDNGNLANGLDKITSGDFWLKNTANTVIVHTKNMPDYQAAIRMLEDNKAHYHTYSAGGKKTHAFVLRGMSKNHSENQIFDFIKANSPVDIQKVYKMRTLGSPLFLVVTGANWTISKLQKEIPHVLRTAVQWENRRSNNPITQCRRCQTWGHSMAHCTRTIRCSKCAGNHFIQQCTHQGPPTCANCKNEHRSFSRQCPIYASKLSQYLEKFPSQQANKPIYKQAPPPAKSAWSPRTQNTQSQQASQQLPGFAPPTSTNEIYNMNFPSAPGQRRVQNQMQACTQQAPPAQAAQSAGSMGQFSVLQGKWEEINRLINYDHMIKALDIFIGMLKTAQSNVDLFNVSREFFCVILPTLNLAP